MTAAEDRAPTRLAAAEQDPSRWPPPRTASSAVNSTRILTQLNQANVDPPGWLLIIGRWSWLGLGCAETAAQIGQTNTAPVATIAITWDIS